MLPTRVGSACCRHYHAFECRNAVKNAKKTEATADQAREASLAYEGVRAVAPTRLSDPGAPGSGTFCFADRRIRERVPSETRD
jgi:hypothetical protein